MATIAEERAAGFSFWQKMALGLALFIVFGFLQFAARGFVDYAQAPVWLHVHGGVMLAWLALAIAQPTLAQRGDLARHRRLGWLGAALAAVVFVLGCYVGIKTIAVAHVPPFFTPPYFLALTQLTALAFAGLVIAAIMRRGDTQWHRRLMLGATIAIMEPALSRVLPMPLLGPWGGTVDLLIQLGVVALVWRHDRRTIGAIHPATVTVAATITLLHLAVEVLGRAAPVADLAARIGGA